VSSNFSNLLKISGRTLTATAQWCSVRWSNESVARLDRSKTLYPAWPALDQMRPLQSPPRNPPSYEGAAEQHCLRHLERACTPSTLLQCLAFLLKTGLHSNPLVLTRLFASSASGAPALLEPTIKNCLKSRTQTGQTIL
jgi:hypothetical protein